MRRTTLLTAIAAGVVTSTIITLVQPRAHAHCEIPCGIYGDEARIHQLLEDTKTIAKSVEEIRRLSGAHDAHGANQLTRWVNNKELHATKIQDTIAQYFLHQRVKPAARGSAGRDAYLEKLADHHAVMVAAMKTKQTVDPGAVEDLRETIVRIGEYYGVHGHATTKPGR